MRALRQQADGISVLTGAEKQQMMNILENYIAALPARVLLIDTI